MPVPSRKRQLMAYHEAGHAVIARKLCLTVTFVAMFPMDEFTAAGAQTVSAAHKTGNDRRGLEADTKVSIAGMTSQHRAYPNSVKDRHVSNDLLNAQSSVLKIAFLMNGLPIPAETGKVTVSEKIRDDARSVYRQLADETEALVSELWPAIERVAEALMHRDLLIEPDLDALIAGRDSVSSLIGDQNLMVPGRAYP